MAPHRRTGVVIVALTAMGGCATVRPDIAIIEAGGTQIVSIDRVRVPQSSAFEIRPGGHTIDVDVSWTENGAAAGIGAAMFGLAGAVGGAMATRSHRERRSVCVKARGGRRYRIKTWTHDADMEVFVIDAATGNPPKTPCGPDEDDD